MTGIESEEIHIRTLRPIFKGIEGLFRNLLQPLGRRISPYDCLAWNFDEACQMGSFPSF